MPEQEFRADTDALVTYKGFDAAFRCRGHQFEVGGSYIHTGPVAACEAGFHACESPLDVFAYYPPGASRYALVEQYGHIDRHPNDSKIASSGLTVHGEIGIADLIADAIAYVLAHCDPVKPCHATGDRSASSATGYRSASSATGDRSASSATGDRSASSATGYRSASLCTGTCSSSEIRPAGDGRALHAVAIATGLASKARAPAGSALCLCHRDDEGTIVAIRAAKVGDAGVQPDTWYRLSATGDFEEATE